MACVGCRPGVKGKSWYCVVYVPDLINGGKKQVWKRGFKTKKAAERFARQIEVDVDNGTYQEVSKVKLADCQGRGNEGPPGRREVVPLGAIVQHKCPC